MSDTAAVCDALFDPASPARADPYALYDVLRSKAPVLWDEGRQLWLMTSWDVVSSVVRDPGWSSNPKHTAQDPEARPRRATAPRVLSFMDPPEHTRLRRLINQGFKVAAVERLRPRVERVVDDLLDAAAARSGALDLVDGLAHPIPVALICDLLGVPDEDRHQFDQSLTELAWLFELDPTPATRKRTTEVTLRLRSYFARHYDGARDGPPGEDLMSVLGRIEGTDDQMGRGEVITTAVLLFVAGHVTSMNLIGNGILALLDNRAELARLQHDPTLVRNAADELLRFDGPVQMVFRVARTDTEVGGAIVREGQRAALVLGAANRDPAQFPEPNRLDVTRENTHHLAFGYGAHYCLGSALARLELEVAVHALVERFPATELDGDGIEWQETVTNRGLKRLPVTLRA